MADVTPFIVAFLAITVVVVVGRNWLPRWARFTLIASLAVIIFFATALVNLGRVGN
jgi:hypothetical protein